MAVKTHVMVEPFHLTSVLELSITQELGEHGILHFRGLLDAEQSSADMASITEKTPVKVTLENGKVLFQGLAGAVHFENSNDGIVVGMDAYSYSCLLDEKKMSRSFQDENMQYEKMIQEIKAEYPDIEYNFSVKGDKPIQYFTLQYQETDWEFLCRMASRFHGPLAADIVKDKPAFFFGFPDGKTLSLEEEQIELCYGTFHIPGIYRIINENTKETVSNKMTECQSLEFELEDHVALGDTLKFQGKVYAVCQAVTWLKGEVLAHQAVCMEREGIFLPIVYNPEISGLSLKGKVMKAVEDKLEIHLIDIDKDPPDKPCQFPYMTMYTTEGNAGWYFMPEVDDIVLLYFPSAEEGEGVIYGSVRMGGKSDEKIQDPAVKYIRTADGQEIMLNRDEIRISTKEQDLYIRINEKEGIQISSNKAIRIESKKEIIVNAASEIGIAAEKELILKGKSCEVKLGPVMDIKGNLKVN